MVIAGDAVISVADIELIYLNLRLMVSSVDTILRQEEPKATHRPAILEEVGGFCDRPAFCAPTPASTAAGPTPFPGASPRPERDPPRPPHRPPARRRPRRPRQAGPHHRGIDPPAPREAGTAAFQKSGTLSEAEVERLGRGRFFCLTEQMEVMKQTLGLEGEELNLDLGPLGKLL